MSKQPERELVYFDIRGRAEPIRLLLAYTRTPHVDRGIKREDWPAVKATVPLGQVPILIERSSEGEIVIPQSQAILRHLARELDAYGPTPHARARCDIAAETVLELRAAWNRVAYFPGWLKDQAATEAHYRETLPRFRAWFERALEESEARGDRFFAANRPTYADFLVFDTLDAHLLVEPSCLDGHGASQRFMDDMRALPGVSEYLAGRRPSDFAR
ncbi:glutathione S-transferase family protein [Polyangium aurulentum]|uniref:glutathione S-transferase family protein n=1 Tax=Polyangium aurulentum TaxID=2567896 RepID=UPI00146B893A|nr:glutathione S-transferase family protein [Polyangium aurulentum]UQA62426.1 glutathione S-transferase family protein [Polyangium aurulentum]